MVNIPLIGVAAALALCAVVAKVFGGGPGKASKSEKAEIMKQLLALSADDKAITSKAPSVRAGARLSSQKQKRTPNR